MPPADTPPDGPLVMVESNLTGTGRHALRYAHEAGWRVIFVTADLARYQRDPATQAAIAECADEVLQCAAIEPDEVEARLRDRGGPFAGVMTVCEYYVPAAAEVARRLGRPALDPDAARVARDKLACRRVSLAAGVTVPEFGFAPDEGEAQRILDRIGLPCVVKPCDESASVGVTLCRTREEVLDRVAELAALPTNSLGQSHVPGALMEQFMVGPEISVETVTCGGRHQVLGVTGKLLGPLPTFVELGHTFPAALPAEVSEPAVKLGLAALDAIGFDFGAAHTEIKLTPSGPALIEVNPRIAGDNIPSLIWRASGIPLLEEYVRMHTGVTPSLSPSVAGAAAIRFLAGQQGRLAAITGTAEAEQVEGVTDVVLRAAPGDVTQTARNSHHRLGYVIATGATPELAAARAADAAGKICLSYQGNPR